MATILIAGGSGLIGTAISKELVEKDHDVIILSRAKKNSDNKRITYAEWNIKDSFIKEGIIEKCDYIIHVAGANIAEKRWTKKRKQEIVDSRVDSVRLLVKYLKEKNHHVKAVIASSAIGWYGEDNKESLHIGFGENRPAANNFLGQTCRRWEDAINEIKSLNIRLVILRTGVVLSEQGGAFPEFLKPVKKGITPIFSSGKQRVSWIMLEDLVRLYQYCLFNNGISGIYNAVAPQPVSNKELMISLAQKWRGSFFITVHVPALILKWILGGMSVELLKSTTVSAEKIKQTGFSFLFPRINHALDYLVKKIKKRS